MLFFLPKSVTSAVPTSLTSEQFLNKGAGAMIGEISNIQIIQQVGNIEFGKIIMKIKYVFSGKIDGVLAVIPFERERGLTILDKFGIDSLGVDSCCWDDIRLTIGQKLIIYFREREEDGTYHLSQSIQKGSPQDHPKVRALFETADKDETFYLAYPAANSIQEISSFDDSKVEALRKLTTH